MGYTKIVLLSGFDERNQIVQELSLYFAGIWIRNTMSTIGVNLDE